MVIKVKEPISEEYEYFREGLILYTYLHLAPKPELTEALVNEKVIAIAYETIQLDNRSLPLLTPMSEVAGRKLSSSDVSHINYFIEQKISLVTELIDKHNEFKTGNLEQIKKTMKQFAEVDKDVENYSYTDKNGINTSVEGVSNNVSNREYFVQTRDTKKPFISDRLVNVKTDKNIIVIAVPILDEVNDYIGEIREELEVANNIFEFEKASDLKAEIRMILEKLSSRKTKKQIS